jgi:hypothetical protein
VTNDFDKNGYVHLKGFLDLNNCKELTQELNKYIERGETNKDPQCLLSEAIHGTPTFDKLLEDLLPHFEQACGKRLYPTYSYARLYKPGEELKKHTDRPACEISATVTLGFEGNPWSIYMAGNKVNMQVGDAVLYRGMEIEHWREKYTEGQWQAQVFLHYVDADGPHADQKYDKRKRLAHHFNITNYAGDTIVLPKYLDSSLCDTIIKNSADKPISPAFIGQNAELNYDIRQADRVELVQNQGLSGILTSIGLNINADYFKFDITKSEQSELLSYKPEGKYVAHLDLNPDTLLQRKLTVVALLNDDFEGGKLFVHTGSSNRYPKLEKGTVIIFPSYLLHGVDPVTKGTRHSCVTWMLGPHFK